MREIEELINHTKKYRNTIIQKKYQSKKNTVCYIIHNGKPVVLKWYAPGFKKNMKNEFSILKNSPAALNMPSALEMDEENCVILMGHIPGDNLCDIINDERIVTDRKKSYVQLLAKWYYKFHDFFKKDNEFRIRGDSILRNFILSNRIWGVDFEESRLGPPQEDVAGLCASILSTHPIFSDLKFDLCRIFINSYKKYASWPLLEINNEIAYFLLKKIQFRPQDEIILRKYSDKIRKNGI